MSFTASAQHRANPGKCAAIFPAGNGCCALRTLTSSIRRRPALNATRVVNMRRTGEATPQTAGLTQQHQERAAPRRIPRQLQHGHRQPVARQKREQVNGLAAVDPALRVRRSSTRRSRWLPPKCRQRHSTKPSRSWPLENCAGPKTPDPDRQAARTHRSTMNSRWPWSPDKMPGSRAPAEPISSGAIKNNATAST